MIQTCSILQGATVNNRAFANVAPDYLPDRALFVAPKGSESPWHSAFCDALRRCFVLSVRHAHSSVYRHVSFPFANRVLSNSVRRVIFSTARTGMAVATVRACAGGNPVTSGGAADYRHVNSG